MKSELCLSQKNLLAALNNNNNNTNNCTNSSANKEATNMTSKSLVNVVSPISVTPASSPSQQSPNNTATTTTNTNQPSQSQSQTIIPLPPPILDKNEKILMKKYARYSKQSPKSVSAVLRQPTLTKVAPADSSSKISSQSSSQHRRYQHTINKQTSLSQLVLGRFYAHSSAGNVSKLSTATKYGEAAGVQSPQLNNSLDTPTQEQPPKHNNENYSVVSSKISLFKKTVIWKFFEI